MAISRNDPQSVAGVALCCSVVDLASGPSCMRGEGGALDFRKRIYTASH